METIESDLKVSGVTLIAAWLLVVLIEIGAGLANAAGLGVLPTIFLARVLQAVLLLILVRICQASLNGIGLSPGTYYSGISAGLYWSVAFGGLVAAGGTALLATGNDPLALLELAPPVSDGGLLGGLPGLYLTGAIIGPIAEEVVFRGITYGFFRRWGTITGIVVSTTCFALLHSSLSVPVTQIIGGVVFCLAYEKEKNLLAPIVIHMLGNAALFTLGIL